MTLLLLLVFGVVGLLLFVKVVAGLVVIAVFVVAAIAEVGEIEFAIVIGADGESLVVAADAVAEAAMMPGEFVDDI